MFFCLKTTYFPFFIVTLPKSRKTASLSITKIILPVKENNYWRSLMICAALITVSVLLIVWAIPRDSRNYFFAEQGKPWKYADFTAPFDFPVYKSEAAINAEKDSLMKDYEPYYKYDKETESRMIRKFRTDFADGIPGLGPEYVNMIVKCLHELYQQGIMPSADYSELRADTAAMIRVVSGKVAGSIPVASVYSTKTAYEQLFREEPLALQRPILQKCDLNDYITNNLYFDRERSEASKSDILSSIALASGVVQKGQKVIGRGEIVTDKTYRIIESYMKENERLQQDSTQNQLVLLGQIMYVAIFMITFTVYIFLFRRDYLEKPRSIAMLYVLTVVFCLLTAIFVRNTFIHVYLLPYAMVPIFIRVFLDSRTAFMAQITMVLICAIMLAHPFEFIVVESVAGLTAICSLREMTQRSQLFKTAIIATAAAMITNLAFDWMRNSSLTQIDYSSYNYLMVNGVTLLFAYPLLYLVEKLFGFTSDITLIELSNSNNDLLRRMSEIAPGTFNHSIQVANLAGEIANKIGANATLVRTGALYHDIGKLSNPIYFTENQTGVDPHDMIDDIKSAQIIISHVTEGQKMADRYNLPKPIRDFISTHHGQGKAKFFYIRYKNEHPNEDVDDLLFTYPGPNPFTREQAILMMADSVEAASRSLSDYTEQNIRDLVNRIIDSQISEGYFRECPITFRDIQYAKTILIEKLKTVYHTRINYPTEKKEAKKE